VVYARNPVLFDPPFPVSPYGFFLALLLLTLQIRGLTQFPALGTALGACHPLDRLYLRNVAAIPSTFAELVQYLLAAFGFELLPCVFLVRRPPIGVLDLPPADYARPLDLDDGVFARGRTEVRASVVRFSSVVENSISPPIKATAGRE
jgi:hypothetical protein